MTVVGRVESRSSVPSFRGGAPSETEIHGLNPQREKRITEAMGWQRLEPGSLNLRVDDETVDRIGEAKELIFESPDEIRYPEYYESIPHLRGGYKYYLATATANGETQEVLVRRAAKNPLRGRLELFSEVHLRDRFHLEDGDDIQVTVFSSS